MVMAIGNFSVKRYHHVIAGSVLVVFVPKMWMPGLSTSPLKMYARRLGIRLAKIDHSNDHRADRPRILEAARGVSRLLGEGAREGARAPRRGRRPHGHVPLPPGPIDARPPQRPRPGA